MIAALRRWLAGFGDPAPDDGFLPDKVVWTERYDNDREAEHHIQHVTAEGWRVTQQRAVPRCASPKAHVSGCRCRGHAVAVTYIRYDGAYRWRDDGFRGY